MHDQGDMMDHFDGQLPNDLQRIARQLRDERYQSDALQLDGLKMRAMARATTNQMEKSKMKSRMLVAMVTMGLLAGGTGAVVAAGGSTSTNGNGAANSQYCPASSPQAGTPKKPDQPPPGCGN